MNNNLKPAKGYYSILQYVPNLERAEGANVGVVLFCPEKRFLQVQTSGGNDRVRSFFGGENLDLERIKAMKNAFVERVNQQADFILTGDDFKLFVETRANQLLLTEPRPMKVFDPQEDLQKLCDQLVGGRQKSEQKSVTEKILNQKFYKLLQKRRISNLVQRRVQIELPFFHKTETYPFSYQNGQPNLVKTVVFGSDENQIITRTCRLAVEGNGLLEKNYKLNILAGFDEDKAINRQTVQDLLKKYDVSLYFDSQVDEFVDFIEETAH